MPLILITFNPEKDRTWFPSQNGRGLNFNFKVRQVPLSLRRRFMVKRLQREVPDTECGFLLSLSSYQWIDRVIYFRQFHESTVSPAKFGSSLKTKTHHTVSSPPHRAPFVFGSSLAWWPSEFQFAAKKFGFYLHWFYCLPNLHKNVLLALLLLAE